MKIAFLGTSEFAVPALKALVEAGHDVVAVYTRAPRPAKIIASGIIPDPPTPTKK